MSSRRSSVTSGGHSSVTSRRHSSVASGRASTPCNTHQRQLIVFCQQCGKPLCDSCLSSGEHRNHELSRLPDACKKEMDELMKNSKELTKNIRKQGNFATQASINHRLKLIEDNFNKSKENIEAQFKDLKDLLEANRRQVFKLLNAQKDHTKAQLREIKQYGENEIADIHEKLEQFRIQIGQDPNSVLCSAVLKECMEQEKRIEIIGKSFVDWEEPKYDDLRLKSLEKSVDAIVKKSKACLQYPWEFADFITFDKATAHEKLRVSENNRQVTVFAKDLRSKSQPNQLPDPLLHVLAEQSFTAGQHYWEVDVRGCRSWAVGVEGEEEEEGRQAGTSPLGHKKLSWMLESDAGMLSALQNDVSTPVREQDLSFIGLFLDYDKERLTFYNVATDTVMHNFVFRRGTKMRPAFNITPEGDESSFLVLCDLCEEDRPESPADMVDSSVESPNQRGEEDRPESPADMVDSSVESPNQRGEEDRPESRASTGVTESSVGSANATSDPPGPTLT
ncbi:hypothetical protein AALO_G00212880 [Alosa alosa]|uniref:Uncharacterized protein n=1 Tax=Alosa alosa TaxID=278164 RepID=A0AAV6G1G0_9TELE|nr:hypothetical protein AALO_G00212880 [Alosa alosa]